MFVRINGKTHYLWRAVNHEGEVLEVFVTMDIAGIDGESTTATVNGELLDGTTFEGMDGVNIVKDTCN